MSMRFALAAVFTALAAMHSDAVSEPKIDCGSAVSTYELNACAEAALDRADADLNAAYKTALAAIPGLATEKPYDAKSWEAALRASQRAWIGFRDAECKNHVPMFWGGGTGATGAVLGCLETKTKQRTKELANTYDAR